MNTLKVFQITNALLLIGLLLRIVSTVKLSHKAQLWLIITISLSPIILYIPWSHPEVFSFVFLCWGLIEYWEHNKKTAITLISVASLQNPAIAIVSLIILIKEFFFEYKKLCKEIILLGLCSSIVLLPYVFYWIYFHHFSLITTSGAASFEFISFKKILSLFIDPNFGLLIYIPVLLITFVYLIIKKDRQAILGLVSLILIAIICSTQLNWNSGMMYINRYSVWMIPIIIIILVKYISSLSTKKYFFQILAYILTTGIITLYCFYEYDTSNSVKFSPVSKVLISNVPALYNPPADVFVERALGRETLEFPVSVYNNSGLRKSIILDDTNKIKYINGSFELSFNSDLYTLKEIKKEEDIFEHNVSAAFGKGWYNLEYNPNLGELFRWMGKESVLLIESAESRNVSINISIASFHTNKHCVIYWNDKEVFSSDIPTSTIKINVNVEAKQGENYLKIVSSNTETPKDVLHNKDTRNLSFVFNSLSIQ
ncbi:hypothetical protein [Cohnella laeviribosi]|uniref:hypothetical protein n=1 Tax=Cohnella laeviribosi TaxID=380174 RepID=UPI003D22E3EB